MLESQNGNDQTGKRWGNRKVEITQFRILDENHQERYLFYTGEDVIFDIQYHARENIQNVVFGIGFYLQDGTWCYGSNTDIERFSINVLEGSGRVRIRFPQLKLIENTFLIDVAVHGVDSTPFDYHSRMYRVAFRSIQIESGIFRPDHFWEFIGEGIQCKQIGERSEMMDAPDERGATDSDE